MAIVKQADRARDRGTGGEGPVPLPDQGHPRGEILVVAGIAVIAGNPELPSAKVGPAVALLGDAQNKARGLLRSQLASECGLAANRGELRMVAREEKVFADEARALLVPCPAFAPAAFHLGLVGCTGKLGEIGIDVVVAMDGKRVVLEGASAIDHRGSGWVEGAHGIGSLGDDRLPLGGFAAIHRVDEQDLVFQRPELNGWVVALAFHLGEKLLFPFGAKHRIFQRVIVHHLAIHRATPANHDAVFVEKVEGVVGVQAEKGKDPALRGTTQPGEGRVVFLILLEPSLFVWRIKEISPSMPHHPVEQKVFPLDRPFAKTETGRLHVHNVSGDAGRSAQQVEVGIIRPPKLWIAPGTTDLNHLGTAGGDGCRRLGKRDGDRA